LLPEVHLEALEKAKPVSRGSGDETRSAQDPVVWGFYAQKAERYGGSQGES
jgi:hypothetical protein